MAPLGPRGYRRRGLIVGAAVGSAAARRGQQSSEQAPPANAPNDEYESQLKTMEDLKAKGMITEEEYEAKRKQILGL
jgi:hypothetical protein